MQRSSVLAVGVLVVLLARSVALGATLDEAVEGDLPNNGDAPTQWLLEAGDNFLAGSAGTSSTSGADYDLVTLNIPAGLKLESLFLTKHQIDFGLSFMGWQHGPKWTAGFGTLVDGNQLFRYQLFDSNYIGFDLLFDVDLPSGAYTIELQDIHLPFNYGFTFGVVAVPEPEVIAMAGVAAFGLVRRRTWETIMIESRRQAPSRSNSERACAC
jgi:hypothetical protein